jgi:hypothetical protein
MKRIIPVSSTEDAPGIGDPTADPSRQFYLSMMSPKYNNDLPMVTQLI